MPYMVKPHPEWSKEYPAVDGITKPDRDFCNGDLGGVYYTPAEKSIRPDILKILEQDDILWRIWWTSRRDAVSELQRLWLLFCDIPNLNYGSFPYNMDAIGVIKNIKETLEQARDYLDKLAEVRSEMKRKENNE